MPLPSFSVSIDLLNILVEYAREKGMERQTLANDCGMDLSDYQEDAVRVSIEEFGRALSALRTHTGDEDFGLHFGEYCCRMLNRHLLFAMMMNCRNVAQAIEKNFQYHNLITDIISPVMETSGADACLTWKENRPEIRPERHFSESIMAVQAFMLRTLTEDTIKLKQVRFSHDCPDRVDEHQRIFQTALEFGCTRNEIRFSGTSLDKPIIFGNKTVLAGLEQLVQEQLHSIYLSHPYSEKICRMLSEKLLSGGDTDIETISAELAMSKRTLQIKLKNEANSFRQIFDEVRKKIAVSALKDMDTSICEVALMLNFSDQSAFHNAFKRWTGKTPGQYRKKAYTNI